MTKGRNLRALCGICSCTAQLAGLRRSERGGGEADEADLARLAGEQLQQLYAVHCPAKLPLVRGMLAAQGLLPALGGSGSGGGARK
jgi:hypothetical protein